MLKGFCQKRYHSLKINDENQDQNIYNINNQSGEGMKTIDKGAPANALKLALDGVSAILSQVFAKAETRFLNSIRSLGASKVGDLNVAQLLNVQMDVTLSSTTAATGSAVVAAVGNILRGIANKIHS